MIIGREHRYVFVELSRTGSTAIAKELISQYGGKRILNKHSESRDFLRVASEAETRYMRRWGYESPSEWGDAPAVAWKDPVSYLVALPRTFYWRHVRREA